MIKKSTLPSLLPLQRQASPASARSFDTTDGTSNELPAYYGPRGGLHYGSPSPQIAVRQRDHERFAGRRSGLNAFAMVPRSPSCRETIRVSPAVEAAIMKCSAKTPEFLAFSQVTTGGYSASNSGPRPPAGPNGLTSSHIAARLEYFEPKNPE
jgi:hypothetical protein